MIQESIASTQPTTINTRLNHRWLIPARLIWLAMTLIALGLFVAGLPLRSTNIHEQYVGRIQVGLTPNQKGELVLSPEWGGAAARAGVLAGDILLAVHDVPMTSYEQARALLFGAVGTPVTISVRTGDFPARQITITRDSETGRVLQQFGLSAEFAVAFALASEILFAVICAVTGFAIFWRRSDDWLALLVSLTFIMILVGVSVPVMDLYTKDGSWQRQSPLDVWFALSLGFLLVFFYLFPSGQFIPRGTVFLTGVLAVWMLLQLFDPSLYPWRMTRLKFALVFVSVIGTGAFSLVYRYRYRSNEVQRGQIRWIVWGAMAAVLGLFLQLAPTFFGLSNSGSTRLLRDFVLNPIGRLLKLLFPLSIAFAIRRHHLWDIHFLINRALVYGLLTLSVVGVYIVVVGVLGTIMQSNVNWLVSILATGLVALLVQPLRDRLQRGVNRMMYGERDDPITVLSHLGQRLETALAPDAVLPSLVETVAQTLKLPYVAIELEKENRFETQPTTDSSSINISSPIIFSGHPQSEVIRFPLAYQSETIGQLLVAPRAPGEVFSPLDLHLLENIARQAGMAVHAVSLTNELQQARQHLVTIVEEERRRLRRDLHDGLGPALASQGLKLAAAKQLLKHDPASAESLLDEVLTQTQETVADIRRLVYGLRPPALDERGLVEAIRDHVTHSQNNGLQIEVGELPTNLPPLTAALEVAIYRIALEALANVIHHAQARHCAVKFTPNRNGRANILQIEIIDDGIGLSRDLRAGVGLRSMRERAEELGGRLRVESETTGTRVLANLPIGENTVIQ